jgi:hypothetical protein
MARKSEQRTSPRLTLRYPIKVESEKGTRAAVLGRTVTQNVAARGAYFSTFDGASYRIGQSVNVELEVPHRMATGPEVMLHLRGVGKVVRIEGPKVHRRYGEDGRTLTGVAIEFTGSLKFNYRWASA